GLDDPVQGDGTGPEAAGDALHGPAVFAVDDNLALAVEGGELGPVDDVDGVAQAAFGRVAVLQGLGQVAGQGGEDGAAVGGVQGVQPVVDAQDRHAALVAPLAQLLGLGLAAREAVVADDDHAVQALEDVVPAAAAVGSVDDDGVGLGECQRRGDA